MYTNKNKLGIAYNVFDGEELLEKSILSVRNVADFICVVWQRVSNQGNFADPYVEVFLNTLKEKGLIDKLIEYVPRKFTDMEKITKTHPESTYPLADTPFAIYDRSCNELAKRNIGRLACKENGCSHFISMDADEFYIENDLEKTFHDMLENNYCSSFALMKEYFKKPIYQIEPLNNSYLVPFIQKIDLELKIGAFNTKYFNKKYGVDPTRCVKIEENDKYKIFNRNEIEMHHMTFVRNNINIKIQNSSRQNNKLNVSEYMNHWKIGDPIKIPNGNGDEYVVECKDIFNIGDISNHVNDIDYFLNRGIEYNKNTQYKEAIEIFNKILHIYPEHIYSLYHRATSYIQLGNQELSIKDIKTILKLCPRFEQAKQLMNYVNDKNNINRTINKYLTANHCEPNNQNNMILSINNNIIDNNEISSKNIKNFEIHQIWFQGITKIPTNLAFFSKSWKENHPTAKINYWDEDNISELIHTHYKEYQEFYSSLPKMIMKIDLAKLFILGIHGGLYVDMDFYCLQNTEEYFITKTNISAGYEKAGANGEPSITNAYIYLPDNIENKNKIKELIKILIDEYNVNKKSNNFVINILQSFGPIAFQRHEKLFNIERNTELFYSYSYLNSYIFDTLVPSSVRLFKKESNKAMAIHLYAGGWHNLTEEVSYFKYYPNNFIPLYRNLGTVLKYGWNIFEQSDSYAGNDAEAIHTTNIELIKNNCVQKNFTGFVLTKGGCFFRNIDPEKLLNDRVHNPNTTLYILQINNCNRK